MQSKTTRNTPAVQKAKVKSELKGQQKKVASPKATGGRGVSFEHRVQATRLLAMCLGHACFGIPEGDRIVKLSFQARVGGHNTDDLVIDYISPLGELGTMRMQLKRALIPTEKNTVFQEAVGLAWLDFKHPSFRRGRDVLLIVYQPASLKSMEAAVEVCRLAVASSAASDWRDKVHAENFSNEKNRSAYTAIAKAASAYNHGADVPVAELHQFAIHLKFTHHDLDSDATVEARHQQDLLTLAIGPAAAGPHWAKLVSVCTELNSVGGDVDLESVDRHIGPALAAIFRTMRALRDGGSGLFNALVQSRGVSQASSSAQNSLPAQPAISIHGAASHSLSLPNSRNSSVNKIVSRQLDRIIGLQKDLRYQEALEQLDELGVDQSEFDDYQRGLWHLLRGMCRWHFYDDPSGAAQDFIRAAELYEDEPKFAAARIRGYLLNEDISSALTAGEVASKRFPVSHEVWLTHANSRLVNGEVLTAEDIPFEYRSLALAWQVLAGAQGRAGNFPTAFEFAKKSVQQADATFFSREAYLRYALEDAVQNMGSPSYRMLPLEQMQKLEEVIETFADRNASLWIALQTPIALRAAVLNLSCAYLFVGKPQEVLDLIEDAVARGVDLSCHNIRIELDAYRDLRLQPTALERFEGYLEMMPDDALIAFGQAAVDVKDDVRLDAAIEQAERRKFKSTGPQLVSTLQRMHWELLLRKGHLDTVRNEVAAAGIDETSSSIFGLMYATRANEDGDSELTQKLVNRVSTLLNDASDFSTIHVGAQLLYQHKRYRDAAAAYTRILPNGVLSKLHTDLLDCYIRSDERAKARAMICELPGNWERSEDLRHLAIDLAQTAHDWPEVQRLAQIELIEAPNLCRSWILYILSAEYSGSEDLRNHVESAPLVLEGTVQDHSRLAGIELRHGQELKGLLRLYQMRRSRLADTVSAALHLTSVLMTGSSPQILEHEPEQVVPGACVAVTMDDGSIRTWTIDPEHFPGLPNTDEFVSSTSELAKLLIGKREGADIVSIDGFGRSRAHRITKIRSAHRRMIELSHDVIQSALTPTPHLTSVSMSRAEDGSFELDTIREQLERKMAIATGMLDMYKHHPTPLGLLGKQLGVDTIDLVRGWENKGPQLEVTTDRTQKIDDALRALETEPRWVVDMTMLTELATLNHLDALGQVPEVFVATATVDIIERKISESSVFLRSGTMFTENGRLGFQEYTEEDWRRERAFLFGIAEAVRKFCIVRPAYGPVEVDETLARFRERLSEEEYASLLLCLEFDANIMTLDDRFRQMCLLFVKAHAWPQAILLHMLRRGSITPEDYSLAVLKMLLSHRTFIALQSRDLVRMVDMGDQFLRIGMQSLRSYLSDKTVEFSSATRVVAEFIRDIYNRGSCHFGAALELLECLSEPLMRHPFVPRDWEVAWTDKVCALLQIGNDHQRHMVRDVVIHARKRISSAPQPFVLKSKVLYCSRLPTLVCGESYCPNERAYENSAVDQLNDILVDDLAHQTTVSSSSHVMRNRSS